MSQRTYRNRRKKGYLFTPEEEAAKLARDRKVQARRLRYLVETGRTDIAVNEGLIQGRHQA